MMVQQKTSSFSSDKLIWNQIYRTMKEMVKSQQSQIETLINKNKFLENSVYIQQEHWSAKTRFLESHISQLNDAQAKTRLVEDAKRNVLIGFKESEGLHYKMQLELAESDMEDFRSCVELLNAEKEELKKKLKGFETTEIKDSDPRSSEDSKGRNQLISSLKKELKKLKDAYKELSSRRNTEVSSLLAEKDFIWNQFRKMESDFISLEKSKRTADHHAREATEKLQSSVEMLQQQIIKKDEIIVKLEAERSILKLDVKKYTEEAEQAGYKLKRLHTDKDELRLAAMENEKLINNLRKELCNLKTDLKEKNSENAISLERNKYEGKCKSESFTKRPIHLGRCSKKRNLESCDTRASQKHIKSRGVTCKTPASDNTHKRDQIMTEKKRRFLSPIGMEASLFHSDFKVPKLKKFRPLIP